MPLVTQRVRLALFALVALGGEASSARGEDTTDAPTTAPPGRLAVASPAHESGDDRATCAAMVVADGLSEALVGRVGAIAVLDRSLVRALERADVGLGADVEVRLALALSGEAIEVRVTAPPSLAGRVLADSDPMRLVAALDAALRDVLATPPAPLRAISGFPVSTKVCALLARARDAIDARDVSALATAKQHLEAARRTAPEDPRVLAALAEVQARLGAIDAALTLADAAIGLAPELALAHFARGLGHDLAGRLEEAAAAYRVAAPEVMAARVNLGLIALSAGNLPEALAQLEPAASNAPTWYIAQLNFAAALIEAGDDRLAARALTGARPPAHLANEHGLLRAAALLTSDPSRAITALEPLALHPQLGPRARALLARARALTGEPAAGLEALDQALAETPANPPTSLQRQSLIAARARLLHRAGRTDEALASLRDLVAADRDFTLPLLHRALVVLGGAGAGTLEALVARHPNDHESWFDLGVLRHRAGDLAGAARAYERCAEHNPRASWARYNRGLIALAEGDAAAALEWLEAARQLDPEAEDIGAALAAARSRP